MPDSNGNSNSTGIILGAAALLLVVLLYFAFSDEDKQVSPDVPETTAASPTPEREAPVQVLAPSEAGGSESAPADQVAAPTPPEPEGYPAAGREVSQPVRVPNGRAPEIAEIPDSVLREFEEAAESEIPDRVLDGFESPILEVSEAEMREVEENANPEVPEYIRRELDEAQNQEMPADVRAAFENPHVEISEAELEMLYQNGRASQ